MHHEDWVAGGSAIALADLAIPSLLQLATLTSWLSAYRRSVVMFVTSPLWQAITEAPIAMRHGVYTRDSPVSTVSIHSKDIPAG